MQCLCAVLNKQLYSAPMCDVFHKNNCQRSRALKCHDNSGVEHLLSYRQCFGVTLNKCAPLHARSGSITICTTNKLLEWYVTSSLRNTNVSIWFVLYKLIIPCSM